MIRNNTGSEPIAFVLGDLFGSRKSGTASKNGLRLILSQT